jgi:hypothetical protein
MPEQAAHKVLGFFDLGLWTGNFRAHSVNLVRLLEHSRPHGPHFDLVPARATGHVPEFVNHECACGIGAAQGFAA